MCRMKANRHSWKLLCFDCAVEDVNKMSVIRKKRNCVRDLASTFTIDVTLGNGS